MQSRAFGLALVTIVSVVSMREVVPAAVANRALVLNGTVTGGASSIEASEAAANGLAVDVVNAATWSSMTADQFAHYRLIILGDPACYGPGTSPDIDAAAANAITWGPTIDGNILITGTDPVYHAVQGGETLTRRAVDFALAQAGKTGAYISLSCYYHETAPGTPIPLLDGIGSGGFRMTGVGCYNNAHIVASHPALAGLTDANISNWSCSVHEAFQIWPGALVPLAIARDFDSSFTASDGSQGPPYILAGGDIKSFPLSLSPLSDTGAVGGSHTVTAQLLDGGTRLPVADALIGFDVKSGPNVGAMGSCSPSSCLTTIDGTVSWTYRSNGVEGDDIIGAFYDQDANGSPTLREPQTTAGMAWRRVTECVPPGTAIVLTTQVPPALSTVSYPNGDGTTTDCRPLCGTPPGTLVTETRLAVAPSGIVAKVPLGSLFSLAIERPPTNSHDLIPSSFVMRSARVEPAEPSAIFPSKPLLEFDAPSVTSAKQFWAAHIGSAALTITASDNSCAWNITVRVVSPDAVGPGPATFDARLAALGNISGIPPQVFKALIHRETGGSPTAYRYELLTIDYPSFGGGDVGSQRAYSRYQMDPAADTLLARPDDTQPRNRYCILRDSKLRYISETDRAVTARELFTYNDSALGASTRCTDQRWSAATNCLTHCQERVRAIKEAAAAKSPLNFVAQTPLAASYGYFQFLYSTAVDQGWLGIKEGPPECLSASPPTSCECSKDPRGCNPHYLFDTEANIARGGGTFGLAAQKLRKDFLGTSGRAVSDDPDYERPDDYMKALLLMLGRYNARKCYPSEVMSCARFYVPTVVTSLLTTE